MRTRGRVSSRRRGPDQRAGGVVKGLLLFFLFPHQSSVCGPCFCCSRWKWSSSNEGSCKLSFSRVRIQVHVCGGEYNVQHIYHFGKGEESWLAGHPIVLGARWYHRMRRGVLFASTHRKSFGTLQRHLKGV